MESAGPRGVAAIERGSNMASQSDIDALLAQAEALAAEVGPESVPVPPPARLPAPVVRPPPPGLGGFYLERILQVEVPLIVQLAERHMTMNEVLALNVGSIIEFEKRFDAELELFANNRQIGLGNAVIVSENFGLRVTRIGTIYETIRALGGS